MPDATIHGKPFPLATDPVAQGAADMENIAEFSDVFVDLTLTGGTILGSTSVVVSGWAGTMSAEFDFGTYVTTDDVLVYTGPDRFFAWSATWDWEGQISGTRENGLVVNPSSGGLDPFPASTFQALRERVALAGTGIPWPVFSHSGIFKLTSGDEVGMFTYTTETPDSDFDAVLTIVGL